jgi:hypothetical protein
MPELFDRLLDSLNCKLEFYQFEVETVSAVKYIFRVMLGSESAAFIDVTLCPEIGAAILNSRTDERYRSQGLNSVLRLLVIYFTKELNLVLVSNAVSSVSMHLLRRLGFSYELDESRIEVNLLVAGRPGSAQEIIDKYRDYLPSAVYEELADTYQGFTHMAPRVIYELEREINQEGVRQVIAATDDWSLYKPVFTLFNTHTRSYSCSMFNFWLPLAVFPDTATVRRILSRIFAPGALDGAMRDIEEFVSEFRL